MAIFSLSLDYGPYETTTATATATGTSKEQQVL